MDKLKCVSLMLCISISIMMYIPTAEAAAATATATATTKATDLNGVLGNSSVFMGTIGSFVIGFAGLLGLVLLVGGGVKLNEIFGQKGGQKDSAVGPAVAVIVGVALMSIVTIKTLTTTTVLGANDKTSINNVTEGGSLF